MAQESPQTAAPTPEAAAVTALPESPKRKGRWGRRLFMLLVIVLAATVWFAPLVVSQTELKQQVPRLLFPKYPGKIEVGAASLDWLRPVVVHDLKAADAQGQPFLLVKQFTTDQPLWKLVTNPMQLGRLILIDAEVTVDFRDDGSNVEDIIQAMNSGPAGSRAPDFELEVVDATIRMSHKNAAQSSALQPVSLVTQLRQGTVEELELTIGRIPSTDEASLEPPTDWMAFRYGGQPTQDGVASLPGAKHLRLKAEAWKMDKLLPALSRFQPGATLSGTLDADARSQVDLAGAADWTQRNWSWDGRVTVKSLQLAAPNLPDRIELELTSIAGRLSAQQGRLSMQQAQLKTEIGELTATGDIMLAGLAASPWNAIRSVLGEQDYTIHGHLDLQKLAALMPATLRIREGTEITAGRVDIDLKSELQGADRQWIADATVDDLAARHEGAPIMWQEPLKAAMRAHQADGQITVDQVTCQSDFFKLSGQGTLTDAKFNASGDLTRLEENLQRFVDLGVERLAGTIKAQGEIHRQQDDQVTLASVIQLDNFHWNITKDIVWQEPRLTLNVHAAATADSDSRLKQIESAELKLNSGQDSLLSTLQAPVDLNAKSAAWPMTAVLEGDLRTWQNRLRPFINLQGWQLAGITRLDATLNGSPDEMQVQLKGNVTNLEARGPEWWIKEPQVKLETAGTWTAKTSEWTAPQTTLTATAISCQINDLQIDLNEGMLERLTGAASYRGDLDKLSRWKNQALALPSYHLIGTFEGRTHLVEQDGVITAEMQTTVQKFVFADLETLPSQQLHWVALWREPELQLTGQGAYNTIKDQLRLDSATVQADGLSISASGSMAQLATAQQIDLKGDLSCDWDTVTQRLGDSVRKSIQLSGQQKRPFAVKGSLASLTASAGPGTTPNGAVKPVDLAGNGGIGWSSATIESLPIGPGDVSMVLDKGICRFQPIDTTIADGRFHLTPMIRLDRNPALLVLPAEKVIDRVQITPEICNRWLKYVTPFMADATQVDGQFSLEVAGGNLPLQSPGSGDLSGTLGVHQVRVRPGASALQLLGVYEQIESLITRKPASAPRDRVWMQMPEQAIPFKLAAGRVHHQNVTFVIGDGTIHSSGSVGMDESIDLLLQVPVQDDWTKEKLLAGLKGKSLKIPVRGTLNSPQIDSRVLTELASQIGGTALEGAIEGKIKNELDDLFKKKLNKFLPGNPNP